MQIKYIQQWRINFIKIKLDLYFGIFKYQYICIKGLYVNFVNVSYWIWYVFFLLKYFVGVFCMIFIKNGYYC